MTKRTLEETLDMIDEGDTSYVKELHFLYRERAALRRIVRESESTLDTLKKEFGGSSDSFIQGALTQAQFNKKVIGYALTEYEVEIHEEEESSI